MLTVISPAPCPSYATWGGWAIAVSSPPPHSLADGAHRAWDRCEVLGRKQLALWPAWHLQASQQCQVRDDHILNWDIGHNQRPPPMPLAFWENCSALCLLTVICSLPQGKICSLHFLCPNLFPSCSSVWLPGSHGHCLPDALSIYSSLSLMVCGILTWYHNAKCFTVQCFVLTGFATVKPLSTSWSVAAYKSNLLILH